MAKKINKVLCMDPDLILPKKRLEQCPHDKEEQDRLGNDMVYWVINTDTLVLADFPLSKNLAPGRFYRMANYNEYFADCLDFSRHIIASRLQKGWQDKTMDSNFVKCMLPVYDEMFRDVVMQKHRITEELRQSVSTFNIVVPEITGEEK